MIEQDDGHKRQTGDQPVLPGAVDERGGQTLFRDGCGGVCRAACHIIDGCRIKRQADREDHRAGDDRREELADLLGEQADDDRDQTAHQNCAGDRGDALTGARDRLHTGQIGKADAENDRKP